MEQNWSQPFRYWILSLFVVIGALIIWYVRDLFEPMIISALLAYILNPFVNFLARRTKLSRSLIVTIVFLVGAIVFSLLIIILLPPFVVDIQILIVDIQEILSQIEVFLSQPIVILNQIIHLENFLPDFSKVISERVLALPENVLHIFETITKNALWVLIVPFIAGVADFFENVCILAMLQLFPEKKETTHGGQDLLPAPENL